MIKGDISNDENVKMSSLPSQANLHVYKWLIHILRKGAFNDKNINMHSLPSQANLHHSKHLKPIWTTQNSRYQSL